MAYIGRKLDWGKRALGAIVFNSKPQVRIRTGRSCVLHSSNWMRFSSRVSFRPTAQALDVHLARRASGGWCQPARCQSMVLAVSQRRTLDKYARLRV